MQALLILFALVVFDSKDKPADDRQSPCSEASVDHKLIGHITLEQGIDVNTPLSDVISYLSRKYKMPLEVDSHRFNGAGIEHVEEWPVSLPELFHVRMASLLRQVSKQVNGVWVTSTRKAILVPKDEKIVKEMLSHGYKALPPGDPNEEAQSRALFLLIRDYRNNKTRLRSGSGSGIFEVYELAASGKERTLNTRAKFTLGFDHRRYYLSLRYDKLEGYEKRIIIRDNSAVYSSTIRHVHFAHETGGEVHELANWPLEDEFPWHPIEVVRGPFDVSRWIEAATGEIRVQKLPQGGYTILAAKGTTCESWTALNQFDLNVVRWRKEIEREPRSVEQLAVTWKKSGDVWYASEVEKTWGKSCSIFRMEEFKANVAVSPQLFHLAALELEVGSRVHDWRKGAPVEYYRYKPVPSDATRRFFDMEAELESLPSG